ncbi:MAG: ATP-binding protein [Acidobacteriota bacterium]
MANAAQIKALIRSHADGDDSRFYAIAMQVAARAAHSGHGKLAQELRALVDKAKLRRPTDAPSMAEPTPLAKPRGELSGLLTASYPKLKLAAMTLDPKTRARIDRLLLEQRQRARIKDHGLTPQRKVLLLGPPGTGKTMTASVLAGELTLPLFTIQLHSLLTKFMGETAAKLRLIFDALDQTRGVYLFDEFDALGGERDATNDVGEIRRILNSFLQFLEQDGSDSLVIAATNHPKLLDRALFRRFDTVVEYGLPSRDMAVEIMRGHLALMDTCGVDWPTVGEAADGLSHADVTRASEQAAKNAILAHIEKVTTEDLVDTLSERRATCI